MAEEPVVLLVAGTHRGDGCLVPAPSNAETTCHSSPWSPAPTQGLPWRLKDPAAQKNMVHTMRKACWTKDKEADFPLTVWGSMLFSSVSLSFPHRVALVKDTHRAGGLGLAVAEMEVWSQWTKGHCPTSHHVPERVAPPKTCPCQLSCVPTQQWHLLVVFLLKLLS